MPEFLRFRACERCGAIVSVTGSDGDDVKNEEEHARWHDQLTELLSMLTEGAKASASVRRGVRRFLRQKGRG